MISAGKFQDVGMIVTLKIDLPKPGKRIFSETDKTAIWESLGSDRRPLRKSIVAEFEAYSPQGLYRSRYP